MSVFVFKENEEIIGVFDDKTKFKNSTFHYILDCLISKGIFKTKKQCGIKIKEDLKLLYSENNYTFIYSGIKFSKTELRINKINRIIIPKQYISDINFIYFGKYEISKPLPLLPLDDLLK